MPRVLVCDDYKYVRYLVAELLRSTGLKVVCAQTGHDALGSYLDPKIWNRVDLLFGKGGMDKKKPRLLPGFLFPSVVPSLVGSPWVARSIHLSQWAQVPAAPLGSGAMGPTLKP